MPRKVFKARYFVWKQFGKAKAKEQTFFFFSWFFDFK